MAYDRFLIAPFESGLDTSLKPFLIPDEAFSELTNAYVWRGRVKKRFGSTYMGTGATTGYEQLHTRLRIALTSKFTALTSNFTALPGGAGIGTTGGAGAATGVVPAADLRAGKLGMKFEINGEWFTVVVLGLPGAMVSTGGGTGTYNTTTGAYTFAGCTPATQINFYPDGVGITNGTGAATGIVQAADLRAGKIGMKFEIGGEWFTVTVLGLPCLMVSTGVGVGTYDTTTGAYVFTGCANAAQINFYPDGVGTTDAAGTATGIVPGSVYKVGQLFSIGDKIFTANAIGLPANLYPGVYNAGTTDVAGDATGTLSPLVYTLGTLGGVFTIGADTYTINALGVGVALLHAGPGVGTGTIDTTTGVFTFTGCSLSTAITFQHSFAATYNTNTGVYSFSNCPAATQVYFYPSEPVMGITQYQTGPINDQPTYAFDTQYAYLYAGGFWQQADANLTFRWHGSNSDFFWASSYRGVTSDIPILFVTNFQAAIGPAVVATDDPMYYLNGSTWTAFNPIFLTTHERILTARIILPFKDRLILLSTIEQDAAHTNNYANVNRCRYSRNGSPLNANPVLVGTTDGVGALAGFVAGAHGYPGQQFMIGTVIFTVTSASTGVQPMDRNPAGGTLHTFDISTGAFNFTGEAINTDVYFYPDQSAWLEPNQPGYEGAGFIDAPTQEAIISAGYLKDRLIVYFEQSTWELAYTGNQVLPFVWQKINTELGSQATFSSVHFDKLLFTIGNVGVHACNGANVERIDSKIPNQVFNVSNVNDGVARIAGVRDFVNELVYWSFPGTNQITTQIYPNRILVYNYKTGSWAFNEDTITTFGYFEQQTGATWASTNNSWMDHMYPWAVGNSTQQFKQILAGNQEGYVFIIDPVAGSNASVLQITDITSVAGKTRIYCTDHNLAPDDYVRIIGANGINFVTPVIGGVTGQARSIFKVDNINIVNGYFEVVKEMFTDDTGDHFWSDFTGTYLGGGTLSHVSNYYIATKQMNPYWDKGKSVYLGKIDFYVAKTANGQLTVDYFPSSSSSSMINAYNGTGSNLGNNVLETSPYNLMPLESLQDQLWHSIYFNGDGDNMQLLFYMDESQIVDEGIATAPFELYAMVLYTLPVSRLQ